MPSSSASPTIGATLRPVRPPLNYSAVNFTRCFTADGCSQRGEDEPGLGRVRLRVCVRCSSLRPSAGVFTGKTEHRSPPERSGGAARIWVDNSCDSCNCWCVNTTHQRLGCVTTRGRIIDVQDVAEAPLLTSLRCRGNAQSASVCSPPVLRSPVSARFSFPPLESIRGPGPF